jgi:uncharacterized protein
VTADFRRVLRVVPASEWKKPLPQPDAVSGPFWKAAAEGRLLHQRCPACAHRQFYPRAVCTACGADPEWAESSGRGTVHTFTVIRQFGGAGFVEELPYVVAMIELEEGVRMLGNVTDCVVTDVYIGMPVTAWVVLAEEGIGIPLWRPAGS